jgi:hypothetical protein
MPKDDKMRRYKAMLVLTAFITGGCDKYFSDLKIVNGSKVTIENLKIEYDGKVQDLRNIPPGSEIVFRNHVGGEGAPIIRFKHGDITKSIETCYYTATFPPRGTIRILDDSFERQCE